MQIEDDNIVIKPNRPKSKIAMIIGILIVITLIIVIVIGYFIMDMNSKKFSVLVDGKKVEMPQDTFMFTEDGKIFISIKDIAPYVGYEAHNGEYKVDIEDDNKMYVEALNGTETTSFYLNSTTISKVKPNTDNDYENVAIKEPVTKINNKMYIIDEGFCLGFNSLFGYNKEKNQVTIQTLPTLVEAYKTKVQDLGYAKLSDDFNNQKALIYGMIVASKENTKYGVMNTKGEEIISPKYNDIQFVESTGEFIIKNNSDKVGIAYSTGKTKITVAYDEIKIMDSGLGLYLVKSNEKYGVIDSEEKNIIYIEYDQIGVDSSNFPNDNLKNQYILYNTIIPAQINEKWRLFDINGNRITGNDYGELGCIDENGEGNALTIGDTKAVVVGNEGKYGAVDVKGNELIPIRFEKIVSVMSAGVASYNIQQNGKYYNAVDFINLIKKQLGYEDIQVQESQAQESTPSQDETNEVDRNEVDNNEVNNNETTNS